ncbi:unnamed protein product [Dicrocoelium dendriticum]|nr:unnamed protein product [Dicrocoelium dendriticum]
MWKPTKPWNTVIDCFEQTWTTSRASNEPLVHLVIRSRMIRLLAKGIAQSEQNMDAEASRVRRRMLQPYSQMSSLDKDFDDAAEKVRNLKKRPSVNELLDLYALFKQATVGDNTTDAPSAINFQAKSKWDAWSSKKGMSKEDSKKEYLEVAHKLIEKYGLA